MIPCEDCGGIGTITAIFNHGPQTQDCATCGGTGKQEATESTLYRIVREALLSVGNHVQERTIEHTCQRVRDCIAGELQQAEAERIKNGTVYNVGVGDGWYAARSEVLMPSKIRTVQVD